MKADQDRGTPAAVKRTGQADANGVSCGKMGSFTRAVGLSCLLCLALANGSQASLLRDHLLVVYNPEAPDSERLAKYYAEKRGIPEHRVVGLPCPEAEEMSREQFDEQLRRPLETLMSERGWMQRKRQKLTFGGISFEAEAPVRNEIWGLVLIRGVPLKIRDEQPPRPPPKPGETLPPPKPGEINAASVDSDLALFPVPAIPLNGFVPNPYALETVKAPRAFGEQDARRQWLVARLDGPSPSVVMRMIDDALYAERHRLAGWALFDLRGIADPKSGYFEGDQWIKNAAAFFVQEGWPVEMETTANLFAPTLPVSDVAFYLGWYDGKAQGPFLQPPQRFARGAIAYHIHSFSASSVRRTDQGWVAPLLAAGATATMGAVYEPFLSFTPHLDVFAAHLLQGQTLGEAAWASQPALSWMNTVVGDPLYQPFREPLPKALGTAKQSGSPSWPWLQLQSARRDILSGVIAADVAAIREALGTAGKGPIVEEALGDLILRAKLGESKEAAAAAEAAYRSAYVESRAAVPKFRAALKMADLMNKRGAKAEAESILRQLVLTAPEIAKTCGLVRETPGDPLSPNKAAPAITSATPGSSPSPSPPKPKGPPVPDDRPHTTEDTRDYLRSLIPQPPKPK
jgi:uncharacterized protein (TIGR03790 family)